MTDAERERLIELCAEIEHEFAVATAKGLCHPPMEYATGARLARALKAILTASVEAEVAEIESEAIRLEPDRLKLCDRILELRRGKGTMHTRNTLTDAEACITLLADDRATLLRILRARQLVVMPGNAELIQRAVTARICVAEQAGDAGLWFQAKTAPEAYLQKELRRLHEIVEGKSAQDCALAALEN